MGASLIKGIIRQYIGAECTRSEGIFGVKRYNSPIYRDLLHSLGTRSEDNFLKVFNTSTRSPQFAGNRGDSMSITEDIAQG